MKRSGYILVVVSLLGLLPGLSMAYSGDRQLKSTPSNTGTDAYKEETFNADFKNFKMGDIVPDIYRTDTYNIKQWQLRHLPAPGPDNHWTYMGGNYVLITNASGKILNALSGDIFFEH